MASKEINSLKWSHKTYALDEVTSHFELPILVRVSEGIYGSHESESFSANDIIKLEKEETLQKVAAHFIDDLHEWSFQRGSDYDQYVALKQNSEILIPLRYKGQLQIIVEEKIYTTVLELSLAFPKYAKVLEHLEVKTLKGKVTLHAGTIIELERLLPDDAGNNTLLCRFEFNKTKCIVQLPIKMKGKFKSQKDETKYTLKHIIENFELPQAVRFVDDSIEEIYSRDIVSGVENMVRISGTLSLNRLVMQKVLIGFYKGLDNGSKTETSFCRRPIVVLPLDSPEIKNIEVSVPDIPQEEKDIYEFVMTSNFSRDNTCDIAIVDGSLYAEFAKHPKVLILNDRNTSGLVTDDYEEMNKPPVPRRPHQHTAEVPDKSTSKNDRKLYVNPSPRIQTNSHEDYAEGGMSLADLDFSADYAGVSGKTGLHDSLLKISGKVKKLFGKKESGGYSPGKDSVSLTPEKVLVVATTVPDDRLYDYPDLTKLGIGPITKPVAHVSPQAQNRPERKGTSYKPFQELSVFEVTERLKLCGLGKLATLCEKEKLDGKFIGGLKEKELQTEPFSLSEIEKRKLKEVVEKNWIPRT
ncbi:hypothetical protein CHS0354_029545 [Potamilus streckersoni]|uniref:CABIT domain-containing protein n=1 Tax=Potamilus streckersoni TaxID=2493646 RepID=A0AAE0SYZ0_9BIVA|nr:hypothetical protein CHS0354_029545 [Potamilus streckersoni]